VQHKALEDAIAPVFVFFGRLRRVGDKEIEFPSLRDDLARAIEAIWKCASELRGLDDERVRRAAQPIEPLSGVSETFSSEQHYLLQVRLWAGTKGSDC
jgi:hypothetical protein